jgi:hypothetical protein
MPDNIRYARYPSAKVFDADGNQVRHLLWGDWIAAPAKFEAE